MSFISLLIIPLIIIIFLSILLAGWWLATKAKLASSAHDEPQRPVTWTQTRGLWMSGLFAGLTSTVGIGVAGIIIAGIFYAFPTSQDPGSATGIGMAIGMSLFCFGGFWIIASSIFGVWLHRRFADNTSITTGLLIGLLNGGFVGIASIIYSSFFVEFSMSEMLTAIVSAVFEVIILLIPSLIGGFLGGLLFQKSAARASL
jgi:hypothetical protein